MTGVFAGTGILVVLLLLARFVRAAWREVSSAMDDGDEYDNPEGEHT